MDESAANNVKNEPSGRQSIPRRASILRYRRHLTWLYYGRRVYRWRRPVIHWRRWRRWRCRRCRRRRRRQLVIGYRPHPTACQLPGLSAPPCSAAGVGWWRWGGGGGGGGFANCGADSHHVCPPRRCCQTRSHAPRDRRTRTHARMRRRTHAHERWWWRRRRRRLRCRHDNSGENLHNFAAAAAE